MYERRSLDGDRAAGGVSEAINAGRYGPGASLPSQPTLARQYGLNPTSISRAMAVLDAEGLIRTEHGRGSYVVDAPAVKQVRRTSSRPTDSSHGFGESIDSSGLKPRTALVQVELIEAPPLIAEHPELAAGERVLIRKRQMFADDRPSQLASSYIPVDVAGGVELALPDTGPKGIYGRLANRGHRVDRFVEQVEARRPSDEEAEFLELGSGQLVLQVVRLAYDPAGRVLELAVTALPAHQWRLRYEWEAGPVELGWDPPRPPFN